MPTALAWLTLYAALATAGNPLDIADQGSPVFQVFGAREGLSDEIWSTVGFDDQGFVWAGSASGVARFDGYRFVPYRWPGVSSLVRDMDSDATGQLWAIFEREGIAGYRDGRWQLTPHRGFSQRFSPIDLPGLQRSLQVSQADLNLRVEQGVWSRSEPSIAGLPADQIKLIRTQSLYGESRWWSGRNDGSLWFRTVNHESSWQRFDLSPYTSAQITDLARSESQGKEELWVLTYGGGVLRLRDDGAKVWRAERGELPSEAIYSAVATYDRQGERTLWMASRGGLIRLFRDQTRVFDRRHGLPSNAVRGIKVRRSIDGQDVLWLATEGGLARARLSASPWQIVSLTGAAENGVFGVMVEPDDTGGERLWVGSAKEGLAMFQAGRWHRFSAKQGNFSAAAIRGIWRTTGIDGRPLRIIGLVDEDPIVIEGESDFRRLPTPWPKRDGNALTSILSHTGDRGPELWMGTMRSGAYRWDQAGWHKVELAQAPSSWSAFGMTAQRPADQPPRVWVATDLGLASGAGNRLQLLQALPDLPKGGFRSVELIVEKDRQVLWASSLRNGVVRLDVSDPSQPVVLPSDDLPAPPDPTVYSVLSDANGLIYICTNNGVQQLVPRAGGGYEQRVFRRRDGMVHDECNSNSQLIDAHNRYWVGTLGGLSVYDPTLQPEAQSLQPKPVYVTRLLADRQALPLQSGALRVPAGTRDLQIDFVLLSDERESESRYRTRLTPYDQHFSDWSAEPGRSFGRLPPGQYRLEIEAMDYGQTPAQPASLAFTVLPLWWEQPWVRASGALVLLGLTLLGAMFYHRRQRGHRVELLQLVNARTIELNQANARLTELSYLDSLSQVPNRRRLMEALDAALRYGRSEGKPIGLILIDIDHFKEYNDRHGHLAGDIALRAVAQVLSSAKRERDLVARYGGEEFVCLMENCEPAAVLQVAERMRERVAQLDPRAIGNDEQGVSLSAGCICKVPSESDRPETFLHQADLALYEAKHQGRNRVVDHSPASDGDG